MSAPMTDETLAEILGLATASSQATDYGVVSRDDAHGLAAKTSDELMLWCSWLGPKDDSSITAITGNGPTSEANARFYSCARGAVISLVEEVKRLRRRPPLEAASSAPIMPSGQPFTSAAPCLANTSDGGVCMMRKGHDGRCP